jgi:hypothetical protein
MGESGVGINPRGDAQMVAEASTSTEATAGEIPTCLSGATLFANDSNQKRCVAMGAGFHSLE